MDLMYVYENGEWSKTPEILLQAENGELLYLAERIPSWTSSATLDRE
jgi:hypothetical protein